MEKKIVKKTVYLWGVIGLLVGAWLGAMLAGLIGTIIGAVIIALLAFISSYKNEGNPPSWLWRSKKKESVKNKKN